ncbi:SEC-C motif family protein [Burkholderia pseudomallei MSHR5492]|nr:SEC-C motif family protein [Burkholderia pseudomallei MSHR5492]
MAKLAPYEAGLSFEGQAELANQRRLIAKLRQNAPPMQWAFPASARKIGRNERCYCGSGKKFKHCHGN